MIKKNPHTLITLPAIVMVAVVTQIPIVLTLVWGFFRWIVVRPDLSHDFVGLKYYVDILTSSEFWLVLKNTVLLTFCSLSLCLILGMALSLLLYRPFIGVGVARTLLIAPFFVMDSVIGVFWRNVMLEPSFGLIAHICNALNFQTPTLLSQYPLAVIGGLIVWKWTPFFTLVLIAGLQSVPIELIEAAMIDGANGWRRIINIIFPILAKYMGISLILGLIFILKTFGLIFTTTKGGPGYETTNLPYYVYRTTFLGWDVGKGAALAIIVVIVTLSVIMALFALMKKTIAESEQ